MYSVQSAIVFSLFVSLKHIHINSVTNNCLYCFFALNVLITTQNSSNTMSQSDDLEP